MIAFRSLRRNVSARGDERHPAGGAGMLEEVDSLPVTTKQYISEKLSVLQSLIERIRTLCEERKKNDEAWRFADMGLRLAGAARHLDRQPYQEWNDQAHHIATRLDFANERIAVSLREFESGAECDKNAAKILGYAGDIERAIRRLIL